MATNEPRVDPETEAATNRALDSAQLRAGDTTASVVHPGQGESAADDGTLGDDGD
ncbi:hypothetical protein [Microbacterium sp. TWP3-1-2b2]|uniref:hypothetical protein n=1 Tax=Microbacterium sp. TWP3-1-2b2 TaxID=2804651 RepID=UPI003CF8B620